MAQQLSVLGIDMAQLVFHVVGMDERGHVVLRNRLARSELPAFISTELSREHYLCSTTWRIGCRRGGRDYLLGASTTALPILGRYPEEGTKAENSLIDSV